MGKTENKIFSPEGRKKLRGSARAVIQILYFLFLPGAFTAAFGGVKYIFTQLGAGETIEMTAFVWALAGLCAYTVVFGRFFCGYACAFGSFGDFINWLFGRICRKLHKRQPKIKTSWARKLVALKYIVLALIAVACFLGIYGKAKGYSPWDVFSMLYARNFAGLNGYLLGGILFGIIIIGMCLQDRFFCRFLCPMGAVFSLMPVLPLFSLRRDRAECRKGCTMCLCKCPADIDLPDVSERRMCSECFQCGRCVDSCPNDNIRTRIRVLRGNEIWFVAIKGAALAALCVWLGI